MTCDGVDQMSATDNEPPVGPRPEIDASLIPLSTVRTSADFAQCLDQLRVLAGPLSHREIESRSGGRLRRTKIGQVLGGELPRREFLTSYLEVCGVSCAESEPWHRVWSRLVSTARGPRRSARTAEDGDALMLRKERDAALARVRRLTEELETLRSDPRVTEPGRAAVTTQDGGSGGPNQPVMDELQTLRVERDAADRRARRLAELNESTVMRLRTAEAARDQALEHVRRLTRELDATQTKIAELGHNNATRPRNTGGETELEPAMNEIVRPRGQHFGPEGGAGSIKRLTRYTQEQADELYGPGTEAQTPVLGEE